MTSPSYLRFAHSLQGKGRAGRNHTGYYPGENLNLSLLSSPFINSSDVKSGFPWKHFD